MTDGTELFSSASPTGIVGGGRRAEEGAAC